MSVAVVPNISDIGLSIVYDAQQEALLDIAFLHGLTGHPKNTFEIVDPANAQRRIFWPQDLLPQKVSKSRILTLGYYSNFVSFAGGVVTQNRIEDISASLLASIADLRRDTKTESRPIIFICHSLGGLVCANALSTTNYNADLKAVIAHTIGAIFLGTPFRGSGSATYGHILERVYKYFGETNGDIISDLKRNADRLETIRKEFHKLVNSRAEQGRRLEVRFFFESIAVKPSWSWSPWVPSVQIVDHTSAVLEGYDALSIDADHLNVCKFSKIDDPGFTHVVSDILQIVERDKREKAPTENSGVHVTAPFTMGDKNLNYGMMGNNFGMDPTAMWAARRANNGGGSGDSAGNVRGNGDA
ncbi:uncharacterized protein K460DRAFT_354959 [Cucurbitaria berberidis CBS 394.84]|uniref:DUF1023 domain-containing protein n=1 Tax=Cucurbitaria berberidis CBS 394.84 TaxID=1168544 RepID=A0A9P4L8C2_9PLEO|nr:uncharacterized protein K460DRAFT_354959 [Cucurbitaria berberidis CBS 394.84]KAF1845108.1 hypothetical protein K460DRAFT_354959 [Cucurbitaria berberidis CBS 394.84]